MANDPEPDPDRVQDAANQRKHEMAEHTENIVNRIDDMLSQHKYPTTSEELAAEYGDEPIDLPNETESLGSVFDRLVDERFESVEDAREAVYGEITGPAGTDAEFNEERDLDELDEAAQEDLSESGASDM